MQNQQSHKVEAVLASKYDYEDPSAEGRYSKRMQRGSYLPISPKRKRRKLSFLLHQRASQSSNSYGAPLTPYDDS